ncbi:DsbA family protein [uncultured Bartonella sp.]|uniref:DsbA family protein n=1 Tax=uncultured Bartonella sp. TaxID=104108 RepID=UPI0025D68601|nr:DsbA family protein [uncultured Bartonella sp.]
MKHSKPSFLYSHYLFAGVMGAFIVMSPLTESVFAAEADSKTIDEVKNKLIADPDFIKAVGNAVNDNLSDDHIRQTVKDYLVKNPEIMLEVQEALNEKQAKKTAESQSSAIATMKDEIFNSPNDAVLGNPKGKITLVEFFDYNCGYCKKSYPDIQALLKEKSDLRIVLKDFPILGADSVKAHIVARAFMKLMPMKFAAFHGEMLLSNGRANEEKAIKIAVKLGVDEQQLRQTMQDEKLQQVFVDNGQLAYTLNINGTPTYILGNEVLVGAVGETTLLKKINAMKK